MTNRTIKIMSIGGLGNQLFLFAYARLLQLQFDANIEICTNWHSTQPTRPFMLSSLIADQTKINVCKVKKIEWIYLQYITKFQVKSAWRFDRFIRGLGVQIENHHQDLPNLRKQPRYVLGYYQDIKYVSMVPDVKLKLKEFLNRTSQSFITHLNLPENYVAIHMRRGDYMDDKFGQGVLNKEFYLSFALKKQNVVILTDDYEYALREFGDRTAYILSKEVDPFVSLYIMSQAKELLISNSTFSWWGGFLSKENGCEVTMPSTWKRNDPEISSKFYIPGTKFNESIWED